MRAGSPSSTKRGQVWEDRGLGGNEILKFRCIGFVRQCDEVSREDRRSQPNAKRRWVGSVRLRPLPATHVSIAVGSPSLKTLTRGDGVVTGTSSTSEGAGVSGAASAGAGVSSASSSTGLGVSGGSGSSSTGLGVSGAASSGASVSETAGLGGGVGSASSVLLLVISVTGLGVSSWPTVGATLLATSVATRSTHLHLSHMTLRRGGKLLLTPPEPQRPGDRARFLVGGVVRGTVAVS